MAKPIPRADPLETPAARYVQRKPAPPSLRGSPN
jgi:hypothetical protein